MDKFKVIETQEQLDAVISKKLERERETIRKEYEGFLSPEDVTKKYEGYLSPEKAAEKDAKIKGYEIDSVKMRIAHETGLSYDAVGFLKGEDEKEIKKSAESLKSLMGGANTAPLASTETEAINAKNVAFKNVLNALKGE